MNQTSVFQTGLFRNSLTIYNNSKNTTYILLNYNQYSPLLNVFKAIIPAFNLKRPSLNNS